MMKKDKENIGLSEAMKLKLDELHSNFFKDAKDGYRLAISVAIQRKLNVEDRELISYKNLYDVGGVDDNLIFKKAVATIYPEHRGAEYRLIEKLADAGVELLYDIYDNTGSLDVEDIITYDT